MSLFDDKPLEREDIPEPVCPDCGAPSGTDHASDCEEWNWDDADYAEGPE